MKVDQEEIKSIKSKFPSILKVLNTDFETIIENQSLYGIRIFVVSIWDHWLSHDEYENNFHYTEDEQNKRREMFLAFYSELITHQPNSYTWKYQKRSQQFKIEKLTEFRKEKHANRITEYSIDNVSGTFELIIPGFSAIIEMSCDWCCNMMVSSKIEGNKVFDIIEKSGLKYFEYYRK